MSGNPKGRPRGSGVRTAVEKVLDRKVMVTVDGARRQAPITEALLLQLLQRALSGDAVATRDFLKIADQVGQARTEENTKKDFGITVILRRFVDPKDCNPALEALGVIAEVDGAYKIQPWAVEAAMARHPKLERSDKALVGNSTLSPNDTISKRTITEPRKTPG